MNRLSPPLSRNTDPMSSHMGADHIQKRLSAQLQMIYDALKMHPMHTARELSVVTGIDYYLIQKRLSVLKSRNLAVIRCERKCTASATKIPAQVWDVK